MVTLHQADIPRGEKERGVFVAEWSKDERRAIHGISQTGFEGDDLADIIDRTGFGGCKRRWESAELQEDRVAVILRRLDETV